MDRQEQPGSENVLHSLQQDLPLLLRNRFVWHILFWVSYFIYEGLIWGMVDGEYHSRIVTSAIELPVKILATYFTLYVLIDKFLLKRKYVLFIILLLSSVIFFGLLLRVVAYFTIYPIFYPDATDIPLFFFPKVLIAIFVIYSLVAIVASFHLIKLWYKHQQTTQLLQQKTQQLQNEKLEAELKLLKSQINPHFLFNTLNNLYVLTLNNSGKAPEMVYKLSELMNYMLYESNQKEVPLKNELQYIENYISLERIRYDSRLDISLNIYDDITGIYIAPLLILPFVENSFKHGVSNQIVKGWIRIDIAIQRENLVIKVENSKSIPDSEKQIKLASGIGLRNVKQRLDLIYPGLHELQIFDEEDSFLVVLKIRAKLEDYKNMETATQTKIIPV